MRKKTHLLLFLLLLGAACRKDKPDRPVNVTPGTTLTLEQVKSWYRPDSALNIDWDNAESIPDPTGNHWIVPIGKRPVFQNLKLGYRKAVFSLDKKGGINEHILEIIPDALYLQLKQKVSKTDFTGRIFIYNSLHQLISGKVYSGGKQIGAIRPAVKSDTAGQLQTDSQETIMTCDWYETNYTNADGESVAYAEQLCTIYSGGGGDLSDNGGFDTGTGDVGGGGHGGGGSDAGSAPAPSNLPGETEPGIKPKEYMDCFGNIADAGATMKVTIYVQEPFPGTIFNVGPNSVGHTAIGLTKANGKTSITQAVGYYPDATGLAKLHCPSKLVDNSDLEYDVSVTYNVNAADFKKIADYIADPPAVYDLLVANCTSFVYRACLEGNITLPNPLSSFGIMNDGKIMSPAGLGTSIGNLKNKTNVNDKGGRVPPSKGPCK